MKEDEKKFSIVIYVKRRSRLPHRDLIEEADKRIEEYFASIPVKTKVIYKNHRINKG